MLSMLFWVFFLALFDGRESFNFFNSKHNILELDDETFKSATASNPYVLVEFYAPWCKYCRNFAPEYEKTANLLQKSSLDILLTKIDVDKHADVAKAQDVKGYPTLKLYKYGQPAKYDGERDAGKIVQWIRDNL
ncbi:unnamed protein product [Phyllotreta striolata]|uniref:protein disulfide-isomerase n=1 Tax=Phyllotreta striolata TaxID=444603 RepID=A0A9N9TK36_PHYSR|nr:unnamed protein product [Phyllotreta striolata]